MKYVAFLVAVLAALVGYAIWFPPHPAPMAIDARPAVVRDSVARSWVVEVTKHDTFVRFIRVASADTLGAILRDRARRPPVFIHDTILGDTMTTTEDTGSSQLCEVAITCQEARRLVVRDSALVMLSDSLRGVIAVDDAVIDSLRGVCFPRTPWKGYGLAFGAGYTAGLVTCVVLR